MDTSQLEKAIRNIEGSEWAVKQISLEQRALIAYRMALNAPRHKGRLAGSIVSEEVPGGFIVYPKAPYALFVERGTGLFGPFQQLIFPRSAKVLHWIDYGGEHVFAAYTMGQPGKFFIKKTEEETMGEVFSLADRLWIEHHHV